MCPPNALLPLSLEEKQTTRIGIASVNDSCVGCGLCASKCPANAIEIHQIFTEVHVAAVPWHYTEHIPRGYRAVVNADHCIGCGVCQHVCPLPDGPAITVSGVSEQIRVKKAEPRNKVSQNEAKDEQTSPQEDKQPSAPAKKVAVVNTADCFSCGLCAEECPLSAITMVDGIPSVNTDVCVGCGICASNCPAGAITIQGGEEPTFLLGSEKVDTQG